jgi:hypothetical protein
MLNLPIWMITILSEFAPVIYGVTTWYKLEVLVTSAILATGKRTVSAGLRVMGLSQERNYPKYHPVLSRAVWSGLEVSAILLRLLLKTFAVGGPLVFGIDETIERRENRRQRHLSGSSAVQQEPFCEGQWASLDQCDVADDHPLC